MSSNTIQLNEALKEMKSLTENNIPFSFSFTSYSKSHDFSKGVVLVRSALLTNNTHPYLLQYIDHHKQGQKSCYLCLLMTFNNKTIYM